MKPTLIVITSLFLFSTLVCGLWMRNSRVPVEKSSKNFHMISGFLAIIMVVADLIVFA